MARAISSGWPALQMHAGQYALIVDLVTQQLARPLVHRRIDDARTYKIDPDALRRQFRRHAGGQADQAVLGGAIGSSRGKAEEGIDRADVKEPLNNSARISGKAADRGATE